MIKVQSVSFMVCVDFLDAYLITTLEGISPSLCLYPSLSLDHLQFFVAHYFILFYSFQT